MLYAIMESLCPSNNLIQFSFVVSLGNGLLILKCIYSWWFWGSNQKLSIIFFHKTVCTDFMPIMTGNFSVLKVKEGSNSQWLWDENSK